MEKPNNDHSDSEAKDILFLAGGASLMILGAGMVLAHPALRKSAKAAMTALMPDLEGPLKAGVRGVLPDVERYLRLKGM
jgi:hypothetical protein